MDVYDVKKLEEGAKKLSIKDIYSAEDIGKFACENMLKNQVFNTDSSRGPIKFLDKDRRIVTNQENQVVQDVLKAIHPSAKSVVDEERHRLESIAEDEIDWKCIYNRMREPYDMVGSIKNGSDGVKNAVFKQARTSLRKQVSVPDENE